MEYKHSLSQYDLAQYLVNQINSFFPDQNLAPDRLKSPLKKVLRRIEYCFSKINVKYFFDGSRVHFNHLNTDQYAMLLYFLSNTIWSEEGDHNLSAKLYYLNKALNGLDVFYEVKLPDIFLLVHPIGTVLGRGDYSDYFVSYQRVTVGGNNDLEYPVIGKAVAMYGGSALVGKCTIGNNCLLSFGTIAMECEVPDNMVVFGKHPEISYKKTSKSVIERYFLP